MVFYKTNLFYALIVLSVVVILALIYHLYVVDASTTTLSATVSASKSPKHRHHHNISAINVPHLSTLPNSQLGTLNTQSVLPKAAADMAAPVRSAPIIPISITGTTPIIPIATGGTAAPHIGHTVAPPISRVVPVSHVAPPPVSRAAVAANIATIPPVRSAPIIPVKKAPIVPLHIAPVITRADIVNAVTKTKNAVTTLANTLTAINYITTINPSNVSKSGIPNHPIFVNAPYTYGTTPTKHLFARLGDYLNAAMTASCPSSTTCSGTGISALKTYKLMKQVHTETNKCMKQYLPVFSAVVNAGVANVAGNAKIDTHKLWPIINNSTTFINDIKNLIGIITAFIIDIRWMTHVQYVPPWYSGFYDIIAGYITQLNTSVSNIQAAVNEVGVVSGYTN